MKNRKMLLSALLSIALVVSLILPAVAEASATALQGTWVLEYYGEPGNLIAPYPDTDITLAISGSDFSGHAGINNYYGEWKVIGNKLMIIDAYRTEAAGPEHLMEQEERYFSILFPPEREVTYEITSGNLTLSSSEGLLVFIRTYREYGKCNVGNWTDITQVAAGSHHTVGLKSDGTVVAVGANWYGRCNVEGWTNITQVAAGNWYTVGLKDDGTVVAVGENEYGECDVGNWTDITQVAASAYTVGVKEDGTVVAVGQNDFGQCDVGNWTDITQVAAGGFHTVGLKSDGTVVGARVDNYWDCGQCDVGNWTDIKQVAAGTFHTVGVKTDGTVVAVGANYDGQCDVEGWTNITQVAAGHFYTVGVKSDGTVVAVGWNSHGQCDVGNWTDIIQVAAGTHHTVGLKSDGTVVAVGDFIPGDDNPEGAGCFIATAAYGTPMAEEIQVLREFRDKYLLTNPLGQAFVGLYYRVSPPMAEFITEHPNLKPIVRAGLVPAVAMSTLAVHTSPAEKMAMVGLLALVSVALAVWATRRRGKGPEYT